MTDLRALAPATVVVAGGRPAAEPDAPLNVPVVLASSYHAGGPLGYARQGTPTWAALEEVLGALEGGRAVALGSGMAAVGAVLDLVPPGGLVVAPRHCYTGTAARLDELAGAGRLRLRQVAVEDAEEVAAACAGAAAVWLESPTNPLLEVADLAAAAAAARAEGALVVVDNTFATPLLQRPLDLGADVVVHSVTKFLSGHSDVLLGAVVARDPDLAGRLRGRRTALGAVPGALEAYLALRGLRTVALRMERACASAAELARRLADHPAVGRVRYPGLPGDPGHAVAARQMRGGFGAVVGAELRAGAQAAERVCAATALWRHATSLGGVESLLERRRRWSAEPAGVPESLVRLSVGIEDVEDLWADLDGALRAHA